MQWLLDKSNLVFQYFIWLDKGPRIDWTSRMAWMCWILVKWRTNNCCFTRWWIIRQSNRIPESEPRKSSMDPRYIFSLIKSKPLKIWTVIEFSFQVQVCLMIIIWDIKWYPMVTASSTSTLITTFSYVWIVHHSKIVIGSPWSKS